MRYLHHPLTHGGSSFRAREQPRLLATRCRARQSKTKRPGAEPTSRRRRAFGSPLFLPSDLALAIDERLRRSNPREAGFHPECCSRARPRPPGSPPGRAAHRWSVGRSAPVEYHQCPATDLSQDHPVASDLFELGFDTVDLSPLHELQQLLARADEAGHITNEEASVVRAALSGRRFAARAAPRPTVRHVADEGFIMRKGGPNGLSVVGPRRPGMNDHGSATSVHIDQDVYGTPLTQIMDGRAPQLFRHDSPDGENHDAGLMLVNLWIPLQQITQPLVLADGRSIDRRRHQLRYGLATQSFLEREEDMVINDIWTLLHDPDQRWYFRSDMDHRSAYVFDTLSTPHGACVLPGEDDRRAVLPGPRGCRRSRGRGRCRCGGRSARSCAGRRHPRPCAGGTSRRHLPDDVGGRHGSPGPRSDLR